MKRVKLVKMRLLIDLKLFINNSGLFMQNEAVYYSFVCRYYIVPIKSPKLLLQDKDGILET